MGKHLWVLISRFEKFPFFVGMKGWRVLSLITLPPSLCQHHHHHLVWVGGDVQSWNIFGSQQDWQRQAGPRVSLLRGGRRNICMEEWGNFNKPDHSPTSVNVLRINVKLQQIAQVTLNAYIIFVLLALWPVSLKLLLLNDVIVNPWLLICFLRQEIIEQLLSNIFHKEKNESAIVSAIQILLTLLETRRPT